MIVDKVDAALHYFLTEKILYLGNVHIFYNSVKTLAENLRLVKNQIPNFDCNIFCSAKKDNMTHLEDFKGFYNKNPCKETFKKFNFYTSRYFEGGDLIDDNATIILVTDIGEKTTKIGISNKGVQAVGRCRNQPFEIIHITNTRSIDTRRTFDEIYTQVKYDAQTIIHDYNKNYVGSADLSLSPIESYRKEVINYANLDIETDLAIENEWKFGRVVNEEYCNEEYNHIKFIVSAWESAYYDTEVKTLLPQDLPQMASKTIAQQLKIWCTKINDLQEGVYFNYEEELDKLDRLSKSIEHLSLAFKAIKILGFEKLEELKFNYTKINDTIYGIENAKAYNEVKKLVLSKDYFKLEHDYSKKETKSFLQKIYTESKYCSKSNKIKTAKGTDLIKIIEDLDKDLKLDKTKYYVLSTSKNLRIHTT